jgi:glycosyltransferase involved in cell wall biosynthesis
MSHRSKLKTPVKPIRISAFFPCYNEEKNVASLIHHCDEVLRDIAVDYEIIIVDDGSRDRTGEIVQEIAAENPHVKYCSHVKNRGYGAALYTGFKKTRFEYVFFSDGDNQFELSEMRLLVNKISEADLVTGYRHSRADSATRLLNAWMWRLLVRLVFGIRITDIDCAFKLFKRRTVQRIGTKNMISKGALINTEIYARMKRLGMTVIEVPVTHYARVSGQATGANPKVILRALYELVKLYLRLRREGLEIHTEKPALAEAA